uniref:MAK10-like protein n=1 Tax=Tanacetum cinerariifolium TaxID=118510 RepID=A0A699IR16_TANCI|nr:MAK10-like protein [Tanacetum cinerariifolium]
MWYLYDSTPSGSISTWEDLTTRFLAQFFPPRRTAKLQNDILMFQQHRVNKITSSCKVCSGPHDTQYCMETPEQAFVDYASSRTDKAGGKWYTFKPEQNNLGDTYNLSWKIHLTLGLVSNFMVSQDAGLSKFEADFKQQQCEMTNKIDIVLKAINDQIIGILPSDTVKNPKLNANSTSPVLFVRSYPTEDPECSSHIHGLINAIKMCFEQPNKSYNDQPQDHDTIAKECKTLEEEGKEKKGNPENLTT